MCEVIFETGFVSKFTLCNNAGDGIVGRSVVVFTTEKTLQKKLNLDLTGFSGSLDT